MCIIEPGLLYVVGVMGSGLIGRCYAALLMRVCKNDKNIHGDVLSLRSFFARCENSVSTMSWMPEGDFLGYIDRALGNDRLTLRNFLRVVHKRGRMGSILEILDCFLGLYAESRNVERVDVCAGFALSDGVLDDIRGAVSRCLHKDVELRPIVDEEIVGGFIVYGESFIIDATLSGRLRYFGSMMCDALNSGNRA